TRCSRDWSSDVCSSDLSWWEPCWPSATLSATGPAGEGGSFGVAAVLIVAYRLLDLGHGVHHERPVLSDRLADGAGRQHQRPAGKIGRASCRERVQRE